MMKKSSLMSNQKKQKVENAKKIIHHHNFKHSYNGKLGIYYILGEIPLNFSNLRITLIFDTSESKRYRIKLDLFENLEVEKFCFDVVEKEFHIHFVDLHNEIIMLTDALEKYRDELYNETNFSQGKGVVKNISTKLKKEAIDFLKDKLLLDNIDKELSNSGIIGEENNRLLLFLIALSYRSKYTLHGLIQSSSGAGKSFLLKSIMNCIPDEDMMSFTRVTNKSFFNYSKNELVDKCLFIQDLDGFNNDSLFSFRELQSEGIITTSTTYRDRFGQTQSRVVTVNANFSSIVSTTKINVYLDNLNRSIPIKLDETEEQTQRIIAYQNQTIKGSIDREKMMLSAQKLKSIVLQLKKVEVINPFAEKIVLPPRTPFLRRTNLQLQELIQLISFVHQFQRLRDEQGRIIATKQDVESAFNLFSVPLKLKLDDLDGQTRFFLDQINQFVKDSKQELFSQKELRIYFKYNKSHVSRFLSKLLDYEYISIVKGSVNRGYYYKIETQITRSNLNQTLEFKA
jgi:hypothetical protein